MFTLTCPEFTKSRATCRCSVSQPRVEIRSTKSLAPGWTVCIEPSRPPPGTPCEVPNMQVGYDGPPTTSAAVHRAAAHGGAAGNTM